MWVYLNGRLVPQEEARIPVCDRGFLAGESAFESLRAYGGRVFRLPDHMDRLGASLRTLGLPLPMPRESMALAVQEVLKANRLEDALLRITVSSGPGEPGLDPPTDPCPTVVIQAKPFQSFPESLYHEGVGAWVVETRRVPPQCLDPAAKTGNLIPLARARREARQHGAFEALLLSFSGELTEGAASNVFFVTGQQLVTPHLEAGLLPGITRRAVLALARDLGWETVERSCQPEEIFRAHEVFLTSTTLEVMPVVWINNQPVSQGTPGSKARTLLRAFREAARGVGVADGKNLFNENAKCKMKKKSTTFCN